MVQPGQFLAPGVPLIEFFQLDAKERRLEFVKICKRIVEEGRVAARNIRRDANEKLKQAEKEHEISEDDLHRAQDEVQRITDEFIADLDELGTAKEEELMEV